MGAACIENLNLIRLIGIYLLNIMILLYIIIKIIGVIYGHNENKKAYLKRV